MRRDIFDVGCRAAMVPVAVAEDHRPAERPTPFVYISTLHLWLPVLHLLQSRPPPSPPCQTTHPRLCLPSNDADKPRIHCLLLYLLSPSLSLLLSYQHHLARSGTQHAATPLPNPKLAGLLLSVLQAGNAFAEAVAARRVSTHQRLKSKLPSRAPGP